MADDLVVREIAEDLQNYGLYSHDDELKVIARAYLERDAQLAAMTAERDSLTKINAGLCKDFNTLLINGARLEDKLTASEAHSENLDKSLTRTEEKLKAATETLERVNGRAQMADFDMGYVETSKALRDIRVWCAEALTPRADGGRG